LVDLPQRYSYDDADGLAQARRGPLAANVAREAVPKPAKSCVEFKLWNHGPPA
jgi:hypothetical protein